MDARELEAIGRKPLRAWNQDGLPDLVGGVTLLLIGGFQWALRAGSPLLMLLSVAAIFAAGPLGRRALRRAKGRLTFPRVGTMEPRRQKPSWKQVVIAYFGIMGIWGLSFLDLVAWVRWAPLVLGLAMAALFAWSGVRLASGRYFIVAAGTIGLTVAIGMLGWRDTRDFILLSVGLGGILVLSGGLTLAAFLHSTPLAAQE